MIPLNGITLWKAENSFSDYFSLLHCFYPSIRVFCEKQNIDNHFSFLMDIMDVTTIKDVFTLYHTIAVVGISDKPERASNMIARYLIQQGFTVYPVNPLLKEVLGLPCFPSLSSLPPEQRETIEIVNIFRKSADVPPVVDEAIAIGAKVIWMQSGITNNDAAKQAKNAGLFVVENRCIAVEHQHLYH